MISCSIFLNLTIRQLITCLATCCLKHSTVFQVSDEQITIGLGEVSLNDLIILPHIEDNVQVKEALS